MLLTLELPLELEQQLQAQADLQQISISELVEKLFTQFLNAELTLEEIEALYADEWVDVYETAWDEHGFPTKGIVIAHSANRDDLIEPTRHFYHHTPGAKTYSFYAGPVIDEGVMVML